jgi:methionine-gamma-lyase
MRQGHGFGTRSVHAGEALDPTTGAFGVPIYQNTTYGFRSYDQLVDWREGGVPHFSYLRDGNPTTRSLEVKLADLEGAEAAVAGASGMAVISATLLHLVPAGGELVASADIYSVTRDFIGEELAARGATVCFVDCADVAAVAAAITPQTRALYTEVFANPTLRVADLAALGALAREQGLPLVVDNTFLSPALLRPIEHGATVVVHSATKYLSGHGNVLAGVACGARGVIAKIARTLGHLGGALSPFAAWTILHGVKTLPLRMAQHCATALRLATLLVVHPAVAAVNYPGLPGDPGHATATALVGGRYGGMLSFTLRGGQEATRTALNALELCTLAVSLGECGSLIWPFEEPACAGTPAAPPLLRLSVGIEDADDLEAEFVRALGLLAAS